MQRYWSSSQAAKLLVQQQQDRIERSRSTAVKSTLAGLWPRSSQQTTWLTNIITISRVCIKGRSGCRACRSSRYARCSHRSIIQLKQSGKSPAVVVCSGNQM